MAMFFSAADGPVLPLSFSLGPDRRHAHDGGAQRRRIAVEDLRHLISRGANVNARADYGLTAIHIVARIGSLAKVRELLSEGADNIARDQHGNGVLHFAVSSNNTDLVAFLLSNVAHVVSRNASGETPLHLAVIEGPLEIVELLMRSGADVNAQDNRGNTPLHTAALLDRSDVVAQLISYGAVVGVVIDEGSFSGATPLHKARSAHVVQLLIAAGADVNAPDSRGNTPLHYAELHANHETVMALLGFGADGTIINGHKSGAEQRSPFVGRGNALLTIHR